jgi:hypothetical protein
MSRGLEIFLVKNKFTSFLQNKRGVHMSSDGAWTVKIDGRRLITPPFVSKAAALDFVTLHSYEQRGHSYEIFSSAALPTDVAPKPAPAARLADVLAAKSAVARKRKRDATGPVVAAFLSN